MIQVLNLGRVPYETALHLQRTLLQLRKADRIGNTLLLLEHPPVITLGRNAQLNNVLASPNFWHSAGSNYLKLIAAATSLFTGRGS